MNNKKIATLIGLAIGDALGGPYEFNQPNSYIPNKEYIEGGTFNLLKGEYTDDTSMALCLANSLIEVNGFDPKDQLRKYLNWFKNGYMSSRDVCFDIGNTTYTSLIDFEKYGKSYAKKTLSHSAGNAPIMRLAPIPMFFNSDSELIKYSALSSKTTHYDSICEECSIYMALFIKRIYDGITKEQLHSSIPDLFCDELHIRLNRVKSDKLIVSPTGYILNTLEVALYSFYHTDNFIDGLMYVISLGYDTDTVGAVYGQIAGAYYGLDGIPDYYKNNLMDYEKILSIANELVYLSSNR